MGRTGRVAVPPDTTCSPPPNSLRYVLPPILPFARHPSAPLCFVSVRPPAIAARREVGPTAHVAPYHSSLLWRPIVLSLNVWQSNAQIAWPNTVLLMYTCSHEMNACHPKHHPTSTISIPSASEYHFIIVSINQSIYFCLPQSPTSTPTLLPFPHLYDVQF